MTHTIRYCTLIVTLLYVLTKGMLPLLPFIDLHCVYNCVKRLAGTFKEVRFNLLTQNGSNIDQVKEHTGWFRN